MKTYSQRRSQTQERRAAKEVGGRVQVASGATPFAKGDVRLMGELRIECKTTSKKRFSLKLDDIRKIRLEALEQGMEDWVFQIEFQRQAGMGTRLAVLDKNWFESMGGTYANAAGQFQVATEEVHTKSYSVTSVVLPPIPLKWHWDFRGREQTMGLVIVPWETFLELFEKREAA
jgi:hypothetical protein